MQFAEQTIIKKSDPRYAAIDAAAFAAKNLYNLALYEWRQAFIHEGKYLNYAEVYHRVKHSGRAGHLKNSLETGNACAVGPGD